MATLRELMEQNQSSQSDRSTEEFILEEGEGFLTPDAEDNNEVSSITAGVAGIASGLIKVPEGVVSLGAELMDATGMSQNAAARVEAIFDKTESNIRTYRSKGHSLEHLHRLHLAMLVHLEQTRMKNKKQKRIVPPITANMFQLKFTGYLSICFLCDPTFLGKLIVIPCV